MLSYPLTVTLCLLLIGLLAWTGRRLQRDGDPATEPALRRRLGIAMLVGSLLNIAWYLLPANFDPDDSLPLHICDMAGLVAPIALLMQWRLARALLYFWAIGLTTQAFITPIITTGPGDMQYWLFWLNHSIVVGAAVYDIIVGRFRPTLADLLRASCATSIWVLVVLPINIVFNVNYGYLGAAPPSQTEPTLVDHLGDWPLRIVWICVLAMLAFVIVWLPWGIARRRAACSVKDTSLEQKP